MLQRLLAMLIKEFKQIFRDPRMKTVIFVAPLIEMIVFGYAATTDVRNIPTAIYDLDNTPASRDVIRAFTYSKYFVPEYYIQTDRQQRDLIDKSLVNVIIRFNRGFAKDLNGGKSAQVQFIVDGTDSNTASVILGYAGRIIERYSGKFQNERREVLLRTIGQLPQVDLRSRAWFNPNLESRNYYVPGIVAMIATLTTLLLSAMAIVREKEIGTIEQLIVSPLRPTELILGKLLPFGIIAIVEIVFIIAAGVLWFKIPLQGSLLLLFAAALIYLLTSLGVGLFISTISSTQQEAMMSTFLFFFPAVLLSGFIFPIANMPRIVQYLTYFNPLRYFMAIVRGIFLKASGIEILWPQMLALLIMGISILTISSLRFHKRLG